jgi:photosystem II stability/assembly factor-like uncharacterized protein
MLVLDLLAVGCGNNRFSGDSSENDVEPSPNGDILTGTEVNVEPRGSTLSPWESVGPPGGDRFMVVIDPHNADRLAVVGHGGVHRSFNRGKQWQAIHLKEMAGTFVAAAFDPSVEGRLLVGGSSGVWQTETLYDENPSWSQIATQGCPSLVFYNGQLYAALAGVGGLTVYRMNGSQGFERVEGLNPTAQIVLLNAHSRGLFAMSSASGPYRFDNVSGQFESIAGNLSGEAFNGTYLEMDPTNVQRLLYGTRRLGVWESLDGGQNWSRVETLKPEAEVFPLVYYIEIDPNNPDMVWIRLNDSSGSTEQPLFVPGPDQNQGAGTYISTDGGETWIRTGGGIFRLTFDPTETIEDELPLRTKNLYRTGGGKGALSGSQDGGRSWDHLLNGLHGVYTNALRVFHNHLFTAGEQGIDFAPLSDHYKIEDWLFRATKGCYTWDFSPVPGESDSFLYATGEPAWGNPELLGVWKADDLTCRGRECNATRLNDNGAWRLEVGPDGQVYSLTQGWGVLVGSSSDDTWMPLSTDLQGLSVTAMLFGVEDQPALLSTRECNAAMMSEGTCWWSTYQVKEEGGGSHEETGSIWIQIGMQWMTAEGIDIAVRDLARDAVNPQWVYAATANGVFKSEDGGRNWLAYSDGLEGSLLRGKGIIVDPVNQDVYYASNGGVARWRMDEGLWTPVNEGLLVKRTDRLIYVPGHPDRLYVATLGGSVFSAEIIR